MQNLLQDLKRVLCEDSEYIIDGKLFKNKIVEDALKVNPLLIKLLLKEETIKNSFFTKIDNVLIFDKVKFQEFVSNEEFLPSSYTRYKKRIGLCVGDRSIYSSRDVALVWPYKDCILEGGQRKESEGRDEIFYNETLCVDEINILLDPKVLTNFEIVKKTDKTTTVNNNACNISAIAGFNRDKLINNDRGLPQNTITDNLLIKGNNLLALYTIKQQFEGKIKLIYIDPPYNTGNDGFKYNDNFNHSTWLTFMKNRLEVARTLLKDDGVIFVQCDDNEQAYLKVLMDEVFGRENFVNDVIFRTENPNGVKTAHATKTILKTKEHIIVFKKSTTKFKPQYVELLEYDKYYNMYIEGDLNDLDSCKVIKLSDKLIREKIKLSLKDEKCHKFLIENSNKIFSSLFDKSKKAQNTDYYPQINKIYPPNEYNSYYVYRNRLCLFLNNKINKIFGTDKISLMLGDLWNDISSNNLYLEGGIKFNQGKKNELMLHRIVDMTTQPTDIVLDFFAGSGTTLAVAHKMCRQWIGIEQMDYIETITKERLKKVIEGEEGGISKSVNWHGGGSFIYCQLVEWNEDIMDKIEKAQTTKELIGIYESFKDSSFGRYELEDMKNFNKDEFEKLSIKEQKIILCNCLDKNHLYVNLSEIEDKRYEISKEDKILNMEFFK